MNSAARIIKNALALVISLSLDRLVEVILVLYIARTLGTESLGEYTVVLSLLIVFQALAMFGLNEATIRELARSHQHIGKYLVNLTAIGTAFALGAALLFILAANWLNYNPTIVRYVYAASISLIFGTLALLTQAMIQAVERMEYVPIIRFSANFIKVVLSITLLNQGYGLFAVFIVLSITQFIMFALYALLSTRLQGRPSFALDWGFIKTILKLSSPFFILAILSVIDKQSSVILISRIMDIKSSGEYAASQKVLEVGQMMMPALLIAIFPRLSQLYVDSRAMFERVVRTAVRLLFILSFPLATWVTFMAPDIVVILYGAEGYDQSITILRVLIWRLVLFSVNAVLYRTVIASNNENVSIRVATVSMATRIALSLLLIPRLGGIGAAVSDIVGVVLGIIQNYFFIQRHLFSVDLKSTFGKPVLAASMTWLVILILQGIHMGFALVVGTAVYFAVLFAVGAISVRDRQFLRGLLVMIWSTINTASHPSRKEK